MHSRHPTTTHYLSIWSRSPLLAIINITLKWYINVVRKLSTWEANYGKITLTGPGCLSRRDSGGGYHAESSETALRSVAQDLRHDMESDDQANNYYANGQTWHVHFRETRWSHDPLESAWSHEDALFQLKFTSPKFETWQKRRLIPGIDCQTNINVL